MTNQYTTYIQNKQFDEEKFNRDFEENYKQKSNYHDIIKNNKLLHLNNQVDVSNDFPQLSVGQHAINIHNTVFDIINECYNYKTFNKNIFFQNNRLFYIGCLMIISYMLYLIFKNNIY